MKCAFCGGSEKAAVTEYIEKQDNYSIVIKNVPCMKCEQCGEEYFSTEVIKRIETILDMIQRVASELTVTVIDYSRNTAA